MQWERIKNNQSKIIPLSGIYIFVHTATFFVYELLSLNLELSSGNFPNDILLSLVDVVRELVLCAILGGLQSIVFARLGVILEFPIWRCKDDKEALSRFFLLWFGINAGLITINRVANILAEKGISDLAFLLGGVGLIANIIYLPLTVCWMYSGEKLSEDDSFLRVFRPITRQWGETLGMWAILSISLFVALFILGLPLFQESSIFTVVIKTIIIIPLAGIDIFVFCWTWLLCIQCRIQGLDEDVSLDDF
ncbi:MAG: hypothetical protein ACP5UA_01085 [Candidatus Hydrogenedens sp.]